MKALIYKQKNTLADFGIKLEEVADPAILDTDLLVRISAFGVNPGETFFRRTVDAPEGAYRILGYEFSGVVEQVGSATSGFEIGDRVLGIGDFTRHGAYAELIAADYRSISKIPQSLSFGEAAGIPVGTVTAYQSLFRFNDNLPPEVKNVLVLGAAGGVGSMAIQLLKAKTNVTVIATASRQESSDWVKALGADIVIDHRGDVIAQLKENGIEQLDFVFSTNGLKSAESWLPQVIKPYGYLAAIEGVEVNLWQFMNKSVTVFLEMVFAKSLFGVRQETQGDILKEFVDFLQAGIVKAPVKHIIKGLSVESIYEAHRLLEQGNTIGKIIIDLEQE
jgi:NADPH2:quinone reductase